MPTTGAGHVTQAFGFSVTGLTFAIFTVPQLLSMLVDPALLLWAEERHRGRMIAFGLAGMAASALIGALAPSLFWFSLAVAIYSPASTLACGLGQAALMDADPENRERRMAQWTLAGSLGDLAAPLFLWFAHQSGAGFRAAWLLTAALLLLEAALLLRTSIRPTSASAQSISELAIDVEPKSDIAPPALMEQLALLKRHPRLFVWLLGVALCSLMDEVVVTLSALWLQETHVAVGPWIVLAFMVGGVSGLVLLDRLLVSHSPRSLLMLSAAGGAACFSVALTVERWELAALAMFLAGALCAAHYPLAQAQAYRCLPERSGLVAAAAGMLGPLDLALPLVLGLTADRVGVHLALTLLLMQPLGLLAICVFAGRGTRRS